MSLKSFLWSIAFKKGARALVTAVIAFLAADQTQNVLNQMGVTIDIALFKEALTVAIFSGVEFLRDVLKHRFGMKLP